MKPVSFAERSLITKQDYDRLRQDARKPGQGRVRAECFSAMLNNDLSGELSSVQPPALVIWGAEDNTVPLRDAGVVADEWPNADLRILPKAGHWPHFEMEETTRRQIAAYLGLPSTSSDLYTPVGDDELVQISQIAQFITHSDIGDNLNEAQRLRLAAQMQQRVYEGGEIIAQAREISQELFIIQEGYVEVWKDPDNINPSHRDTNSMQHVANLREGQITGELAMLDEGERSADLVAGGTGVKLLVLSRERLLTLSEDDAVLGSRVLWNISRALSRRVRFVLWQLNRNDQRQEAEVSF
jgi:CRP-like cAMP-binding protein